MIVKVVIIPLVVFERFQTEVEKKCN